MSETEEIIPKSGSISENKAEHLYHLHRLLLKTMLIMMIKETDLTPLLLKSMSSPSFAQSSSPSSGTTSLRATHSNRIVEPANNYHSIRNFSQEQSRYFDSCSCWKTNSHRIVDHGMDNWMVNPSWIFLNIFYEVYPSTNILSKLCSLWK